MILTVFKLSHLRNALLGTLVLMLIYVLYKRLLKVLSKDKIHLQYPQLQNSLEWASKKEAIIKIELFNPSSLLITLHNEIGDQLETIAHGDFPTGLKGFPMNIEKLGSGKYYFKVVSDKQQASQYFIVE
jgi:hypothetical protein